MKIRRDYEAERKAKLEALYEIREQNGTFKLYFKKKSGFKFKQSFKNRWQAEGFAAKYLQQSCLVCIDKGQVYKVRNLGGVVRSRAFDNHNDLAGKITHCPECQAKHIIRATSWRLCHA